MADHGESLGEHGEETHGVFLYDETIHVPLLLKLPAERAAGRQVETCVGVVDVAPTMLQEVGIPVPGEMQGESLLGMMKTAATNSRPLAATLENRPAYAETDYPHRAFGWSSLRALRSGKYLYIQAPERELYNQAADPHEVHNLAPNTKAVTTMASQLDEFREKTSLSLMKLARPDPEQVEKLRALDYVASDASKSNTSSATTGIDPKGKIEVANLLHDAMLNVEDARYEQAVPRLERVLEQQAEMPIAEMQLGIAESRLKNYSKALAPLQKAVALLPDSGMGVIAWPGTV
jgi:tetratricopeptide (TPR) repeat protein